MTIDYPPEFGQERVQPSHDEIAAMQKALFAKRLTIAVGIAIVLAVVGAGTYFGYVIRHQQVQNAPVLSSTHQAATASQRSLHLIRSCVTPGRPCNARGQKQTAAIIGTFNRQVIVTAACEVVLSRQAADETATELTHQITACVADTLAQLKH